MKELFTKIKNLFARKTESVKEKTSPIKPYRDWVVIFIFSVAGIIVVSAFALYLLFIFQSGEFFGSVKTQTPKNQGLEQAKLVETLDLYKKRIDDFNKRIEGRPALNDPSI